MNYSNNVTGSSNNNAYAVTGLSAAPTLPYRLPPMIVPQEVQILRATYRAALPLAVHAQLDHYIVAHGVKADDYTPEAVASIEPMRPAIKATHSEMWIATYREGIVGIIVADGRGDDNGVKYARFVSLHVVENFRRLGIGRRLVHQALMVIDETTSSMETRLWMARGFQDEASMLFQSMGFRLVLEVDGGRDHQERYGRRLRWQLFVRNATTRAWDEVEFGPHRFPSDLLAYTWQSR